MKKRFLSLGLVAVMAMSLTACDGSSTAETTEAVEITAADAKVEGSEAADTTAVGGVFKIGGIGPVTGGAVMYGVAVQHGIGLAVKEVNEAGGTNGAQIELNFQDDKYDAEKSVNAYNTLEDWGMQVLMGTITSTPCIAVADKTTADNIFQIIPSGSVVECTASPNVFRICFSSLDQGAASAKYIGGNKLASKIAVIYDSSDVYPNGIYEKFAEESANQGIEIVVAEALTADSNKDFSIQLQKSKDAGAELVFLLIYYTKASLILQQASTIGLALQFLGYDGMDGILQIENSDTKLAEGLMLLTPFAADATDDPTVRLVDSYRTAYNEAPVQFAADAYDATYAIKAAIEDANVTPDADAGTIRDVLKASILNIKLDGLTGEGMTWTEDGEPYKAPKAVKVADGTYTAM